MKHFQSRLAILREEFPSSKAFAERTGLSQASISRLLSGKGDPDARTLQTLCERMGPKVGADLLYAYLVDQVPRGLRRYVRVMPAYRFTPAEIRSEQDLLSRLPQRWHEMLTRAGELCLEDDQAGEFLEGCVE